MALRIVGYVFMVAMVGALFLAAAVLVVGALHSLATGERRRCRVCGCSEWRPCPGGCSWVDVDLCSDCAPQVSYDWWSRW